MDDSPYNYHTHQKDDSCFIRRMKNIIRKYKHQKNALLLTIFHWSNNFDKSCDRLMMMYVLKMIGCLWMRK